MRRSVEGTTVSIVKGKRVLQALLKAHIPNIVSCAGVHGCHCQHGLAEVDVVAPVTVKSTIVLVPGQLLFFFREMNSPSYRPKRVTRMREKDREEPAEHMRFH